MRPSGVYTATTIFAILGTIFMGLSVYLWATVDAAQADWQSVEGEVIAIEAKRPRITGERRPWRAYVTYRYLVNGEIYSSNRYSLETGIAYGGFGYRTRQDALGVIAHLPVGAPLTVHYDPAQPAEAALTLERDPGTYIGFGAALIMFGLAIGFYMFFPRRI